MKDKDPYEGQYITIGRFKLFTLTPEKVIVDNGEHGKTVSVEELEKVLEELWREK
jgi:hypothetical protein